MASRLRKEKITTLDQLRAAVDWMERFEDIGPRTAHIIREELARLASPDKDPSPPLRHDPKK
jgi:hypothetical protein